MLSEKAFEFIKSSGVLDDKNTRRCFVEKFNDICLADYPLSFDIIKDAQTNLYYLIPSDINKTEAFPVEKINYIVCLPAATGDMVSDYVKKITTYAERVFGPKRPSRLLAHVFYGFYLHGLLLNFFKFETHLPVQSADKNHIIKKENILYPVRYSPIEIDLSDISDFRPSSIGITFAEGYSFDMDLESYFNNFARSISYGQRSFADMDSYSLPEYYEDILNKAFSEVVEKPKETSGYDFDKAEYEIMSLGSKINEDKHRESAYEYYNDKRRLALYEKVNEYITHKNIDKLSVFNTIKPGILVMIPSFKSSDSEDHSDDIFKCLAFINKSVYDDIMSDIRKPSLKRVYFMALVYTLSSVSSRAPFLFSEKDLDDVDFNIDDMSQVVLSIDTDGYFDYETDDYRFDPDSLSQYEMNGLLQDRLSFLENNNDKINLTGRGFIKIENGNYYIHTPVVIESRFVMMKFLTYADDFVYDESTCEFVCDIYYDKNRMTEIFVHDERYNMNIDDLAFFIYKASKSVSFIKGFYDVSDDMDPFLSRLYISRDRSVFVTVNKQFVFRMKNGLYGLFYADDIFDLYKRIDGSYEHHKCDSAYIRQLLHP